MDFDRNKCIELVHIYHMDKSLTWIETPSGIRRVLELEKQSEAPINENCYESDFIKEWRNGTSASSKANNAFKDQYLIMFIKRPRKMRISRGFWKMVHRNITKVLNPLSSGIGYPHFTEHRLLEEYVDFCSVKLQTTFVGMTSKETESF